MPLATGGLFVVGTTSLVLLLLGTRAVAERLLAEDPAAYGQPFQPKVHRMKAEQRLASAFAAVFESKGEAVRSVGAASESTRFRPSLLIDAPFASILISEGEVLAPRPRSTGKLAVAYLAPVEHGWQTRARFIPVIESGANGRLGDWRMLPGLSEFPVLQVDGEGSWGGLRCRWTTLLELRPVRPVELITVPMARAAAGSAPSDAIEGIIVRADRERLVIAYTGASNFSETYVRRGEQFERAGRGRSRIESC